MTSKLFSDLGLSAEVLRAIDQLGFEQASPIQSEAIPVLLQGKDVVGQSQTGSGKTAAFAIPAIERVETEKRMPQVLILCPTRELAVQVAEEVHKLAQFKRGLHALPVYGGQSYDRQLYGLRQGAQIIIGTPGRVMDHMRRGTLKLGELKMVILDEVDVMLNMGFRDDIELILQDTPKERQTVFFSATIPKPIQMLVEKYAREPQSVKIEQKALTVPTVEQVYYEVDRRMKLDLLTRLIDLHDLKLGIIFCNTKRMVDDLVDHLNAQGYLADRLHGDMTQMMRDRVMQKFRKSGLDFLVATDVAARGINVDDVEVVFNYDLPYDGEDYVHRIGRTGRKGRSGRAISFASGREVFQIRNIERYTNMRIPRGKPPTAAEVEEARELVFLEKLRATLKEAEFKRYDHLVERLLEEGYVSTDIASALIHQLQGSETVAPQRETREFERREERSFERERNRRPERPPRRENIAPRRELAAARQEHLDRRPAPPSAPQMERREHAKAPPLDRPEKPVTSAPKLSVKPSAPIPATAAQPDPAAPDPVKANATTAAPPAKVEARPHFPAPETTSDSSSDKQKPKRTGDYTRLWINIGDDMAVVPRDVVTTISGVTGLPPNVVAKVDIRERHMFVDVAAPHAHRIIANLNRSQMKGRKIKVKVA